MGIHPPTGQRAARVFTTLEEVLAAEGTLLGSSDWLLVDQARVDAFADATGDHQWIHVDIERAQQGPFGTTIAHGYLTLSLLPLLGSQVFEIETAGALLNYGVNKVRFPRPLLVGSRVRAAVTLEAVHAMALGHQLALTYLIQVEGEETPACVAQTVALMLP